MRGHFVDGRTLLVVALERASAIIRLTCMSRFGTQAVMRLSNFRPNEVSLRLG